MRIPNFLKRRKIQIWLSVALVLIVGGFFLFRGNQASSKTATAQIGNIERVISVTGQISANDKVDLSFDHSGRIVGVYVRVGDQVYAGKILARLDSADLSAQLQSADASVLAAQAKFDQLINGARSEDLNILQINLNNAQKVLTDAKTIGSLVVSKTALNSGINALVTVSDLFSKYKHLIDNSRVEKILNDKEQSLFLIYDQRNLRYVDSWYFLSLQTGLIQKISQSEINPQSLDGAELLHQVKQVLFSVQNALDSLYSGLNLAQSADTDKAAIISAKSGVLAQITATNNHEQAILNAQNTVNNYQSQLDLKKAPPTQYEVDIAKSQLIQAKAGQTQIQAQLEKNILRSPIAGMIADTDLRVGEIASPAQIAASIIGQSKFQIEANIAEVDVSKIKVSDPVKVTLDAYGPDIVWDATVSQIYPTERVIEGVSTYKTVIVFLKTDDRIKSGMTANLDIQNDKRENALYLPQRAIIRKDGKKLVKLILPEDFATDSRFANVSATTETDKTKTAEIEIQTGLYGSDGRVEILSGLIVGDKIAVE